MRAIKFFSGATLAMVIGLVGLPSAAAVGNWSAPVDASLEARNIQQHQFTVDSAGTATAIWMNDGIIQSSSRPNGGTWSTPVDVSLTGAWAHHPQVTVDSSGLATAVWYRSNGSNDIIQSSSRPLGGNWSTPVDVSLPGGNASRPQVTVDPLGRVTAIWARSNGSNEIIQSSSRPSGGDWSSPVDVSLEGENAAQQQVTVDSAGLATAVWTRYIDGDRIVQSSTRPSGGDWSTPVNVSVLGDTANDPQVTVDSSGLVSVVWSRRIGDNLLIQSSSRPSGGTWSTPVELSLPGQDASKPQVTVDSTGLATAVWWRYADGGAIVQSSSSRDGGPWTTPIDVSSPGERASQPQLTVDSSGQVTAVWRREVGNGPESTFVVQSSSLPRGGTWSIPVDLSIEGESGDEPKVKADPTGAVTAVWRRTVEGNRIIQSSFIAGPTPALANTGGEFDRHLGFGLIAAVLGAGVIALSRRKRNP